LISTRLLSFDDLVMEGLNDTVGVEFDLFHKTDMAGTIFFDLGDGSAMKWTIIPLLIRRYKHTWRTFVSSHFTHGVFPSLDSHRGATLALRGWLRLNYFRSGVVLHFMHGVAFVVLFTLHYCIVFLPLVTTLCDMVSIHSFRFNLFSSKNNNR
jgi:hypothetical protein